MLLLDTASVARGDRADLFQDLMSEHCTRSAATFETPDQFQAEVHGYDLGPARVLTIEASGTTLRRTPQMARGMHDSPIVLVLPMRTNNRLMWEREDRLFEPTDLMIVDLAAPYTYSWSGAGASYAFHVDLEQLDLPMDTIRAAAREPRKSPIYSLVRDHICQVMIGAQRLVDSGAAAHVAAASLEMMHALIVSAAGDQRRLGQALHTSMAARVQTYVRHHLREPDLSPTQIAAANGISVRQLYKLYETLGVSLEQSIIEQRLKGVRSDLSTPSLGHRSIAAIARSWGFANPTFFSTRFRQRFGVTARQWRAQTGSASMPAQPEFELSGRLRGTRSAHLA